MLSRAPQIFFTLFIIYDLRSEKPAERDSQLRVNIIKEVCAKSSY